MAWAKNGTPHTLTSTANDMDITDITANNFNIILVGGIGNGGANSAVGTRVGTTSIDPNAHYSEANNENGTENSGVNRTYFYHLYNGYDLQFTVMYAINVSGYEKLFMAHTAQAEGSAASSAVSRTDAVGKWVTTSGQWDKLQLTNYAGSDFLTGSNLSALGGDITPVAQDPPTVSDGAIFYETDTNKSYVLNSGTWTEL